MKKLPKDLIRPEIQSLSAYHVPPATGMIKLDAMENPYPWPEELQTTWLKKLKTLELNRYPDPTGQSLCDQLRKTQQIPDDQEIILGNGSDELIQIIAMAVADKGRVVMAPEPGFVMYNMISKFLGLEYVGVALNETDFSVDKDAILAAIDQHQPAVIFLAYPNNPTGNHWDRKVIESIITHTDGLVVLDEAYAPFAADSFMQDLGQYPNLLVMRTLSKFGLAGIRLGFLCGPDKWLHEFNKIRLPYNINVLTQATAEFALEHKFLFDQQADWIKQSREELFVDLKSLTGLQVFHSDANFILMKTRAGDADQIFESLKQRGVLIKNLSPTGGMLQDCLRVTVGTAAQNQALIEALSEVLQ